MKRLSGGAALLLFTMVMTVNAALRIHVAKDRWVTAGAGKGTDSVWYCAAAYQGQARRRFRPHPLPERVILRHQWKTAIRFVAVVDPACSRMV